MKTSRKNRLSILSLFFPSSQVVQLRKRREFRSELKRRDRARFQTEMVEFIALPFPSKLKIWSFQVVVVQRRQINLQKSVIHVLSCCSADYTYCFFDVFVAVAIVVLCKVPKGYQKTQEPFPIVHVPKTTRIHFTFIFFFTRI